MSSEQMEKEVWSKALEEGRAKRLEVTSRRSGNTGRVGLERLHSLERAEYKRILRLYPFHRLRMEIDPDTGLVHPYVMPNEAYLELVKSCYADPKEQFKAQRIENVMNGIDSAHRAAAEAIQKLEAGQIRHYDEIEAIAGVNAGEAFNAVISQAHRPALALKKEDGQTITVGGHPKLPRDVPRRDTSHFVVEVRGVERDAPRSGAAKLKVLEVESDEAKTGFVPGHIYPVKLRTRSDVRTVKLFGQAIYLELPVRVEVGVSINVRAFAHACTYWVRSLDEEGFLKQIEKANNTGSTVSD